MMDLSIIIVWMILFQDIDQLFFHFFQIYEKLKSSAKFKNFDYIDFSKSLLFLFELLSIKIVNDLTQKVRSLHFIFVLDRDLSPTPWIERKIIRHEDRQEIFRWYKIFFLFIQMRENLIYEDEAIEYRIFINNNCIFHIIILISFHFYFKLHTPIFSISLYLRLDIFRLWFLY